MRVIFALLVIMGASLVESSTIADAKAHRRPKAAATTVGVYINDSRLAVNPPPRYIGGYLLVPVRRILDALGLPFVRNGNTITTTISDRSISLHIGSPRADVDGERIELRPPPIEVKGVLYAPLRFFTKGLGAQANFDPRTKRVNIVSSLVGQSVVVQNYGETPVYSGTVEAVDEDSEPPSVTVTQGSSVKTIRVPRSQRVDITDVITGASITGNIEDMHVGDFAKITMRKGDGVQSVVDMFGSRSGRIAAISGNFIVLDDGRVLTPSGITTLSLNGNGARVSDLAVGDNVSVRYNVETSEVREIIATRSASGTTGAGGPVKITSIEPSISNARPGSLVEIVMQGTPRGSATYDVGSYASGLPMIETAPGVYRAQYRVGRGLNFSNAPIFGSLTVGGVAAPRMASEHELSVATTPPAVVDFAPDQNEVINNPQPSIYATFAPGAVPINVSSIQLIVNGHDVTASSTRTASFIEYHVGWEFSPGPVQVTVRASDMAGNTMAKSWTFTVRTH